MLLYFLDNVIRRIITKLYFVLDLLFFCIIFVFVVIKIGLLRKIYKIPKENIAYLPLFAIFFYIDMDSFLRHNYHGQKLDREMKPMGGRTSLESVGNARTAIGGFYKWISLSYLLVVREGACALD